MTDLARPMIRQEVEAVVGMDNHTLLHDPVTGHYHRLGSTAALLVPHLDGQHTSSEIQVLVYNESSGSVNLRAEAIDSFVASLHAKSLLAGDAPVSSPRRTVVSRLMPRVIISRSFANALAPAARAISRLPPRPATAFALIGALVGYSFGFSVLLRHGIVLDRSLTLAVIIAIMIQLTSVLLHESWHGIIAAVNGHPVRGLGIALLFWTIPVAYVDRTDSYRVRSRGGRVGVALAGMVSDGWVCGVTGWIALQTSGLASSTAFLLLTFQLLLLISNLNPFVPSDTVSAIEAGAGLVDVRGRAFAIVRARIGRQPMPIYLARASTRARLGYLVYGMLSMVFAAVVVLGFFTHLALSIINALAVVR